VPSRRGPSRPPPAAQTARALATRREPGSASWWWAAHAREAPRHGVHRRVSDAAVDDDSGPAVLGTSLPSASFISEACALLMAQVAHSPKRMPLRPQLVAGEVSAAAASAMLSPSMAHRIEPPASTTSTFPLPGDSNILRTCSGAPARHFIAGHRGGQVQRRRRVGDRRMALAARPEAGTWHE
jgi:hypothetical protein